MVCSLTGQVPAELPQTLTAQEQCVYVCVCAGGSECSCTSLTETMRIKKKKRHGVMVKGISGRVYTYSLTDKQRGAHFIANVVRRGAVQVSVFGEV